MKKISFLINIVILMCLISCESKVESDINILLSGHIKIEVTDSGFTNPEQPTKTSEIGYQTKFEKGDIVGVYIINTQSSQDNKENIPLTFDGVSWNFPSNVTISNINNIQLFAYYPYDGSMSLVKPSVSDGMAAEDFFADYILKQTLVGNQAEYEDYTKADIMVGKGSLYGSILKFEMKHQMSLMVIKLPNEVTYAKEYYLTTDPDYKWQRFKRTEPASLSNIQFTGFTPYEVRVGEYRYIVPSSHIFASNVSGSFEVNGESRQYSFTPQGLNKNEYKEYKITATIIEETIAHTLAIGDIYKSDGGLISQAELANPGITEEEKTECVGVVFSIDNPANQDQGLDTKFNHGLVMALKDAVPNKGKVTWGQNINENLNDCVSLNDYRKNLSGYSNSYYIWTNYINSLNDYSAFKVVKEYKASLPTGKTSGWFMPSVGQWIDIYANLGGVSFKNGTSEQVNTHSSYYFYILNAAGRVSEAIDRLLNNIGTSYVDLIGWSNGNTVIFWSSSEHDVNNACYVDLYENGNLSMGPTTKGVTCRVRCIFAF